MSNLPALAAGRPPHGVGQLLNLVMHDLAREHPGHAFGSAMLPPARAYTAGLLLALGFNPVDEIAEGKDTTADWAPAEKVAVLGELVALVRWCDRLLSMRVDMDALANASDRIRYAAERLAQPDLPGALPGAQPQPELAAAVEHVAAELAATPLASPVEARALLASARDRIHRMIEVHW